MFVVLRTIQGEPNDIYIVVIVGEFKVSKLSDGAEAAVGTNDDLRLHFYTFLLMLLVMLHKEGSLG